MGQAPLAEDIQDYAQNIVDTVREPLLILDTTLRVRSANRAFYQTFHVSPSETEGHLIYELGNGQWDIPRPAQPPRGHCSEELRFRRLRARPHIPGDRPKSDAAKRSQAPSRTPWASYWYWRWAT